MTIEQVADLPADQARYRLCESVSPFLIAAADQHPILLVIDDLQWADQDTMEALRYVARSIRSNRVLTIGIYRESEVAPDQRKALQSVLASLQREVAPEYLWLRGLNLPEVNHYLELLAAQPLPQALVRAFHEQTGGNPFFIRELFHHLVEETRITHRAGRWTTDFSISELGIPPAVNQVVAEVLELMPGSHAAAELAFQYFASAALPGSENGIHHCLIAAELAARQYAYDQQVTLLRMARDLARGAALPQRADIACRQAIAEASALLLTDAWHTGEHALELLNQSGAAPHDIAAFCIVLAYGLKDGGAPLRDWSPFVDHGLTLNGSERDLSWARLMLLKGRVEAVLREGLHISRWAGHEQLAVALARAHGDEGDHARTMEPLGWRAPEETCGHH